MDFLMTERGSEMPMGGKAFHSRTTLLWKKWFAADVLQSWCLILLDQAALVCEVERDIWSNKLRLSGWSLKHLTRNKISCNSCQYMRGRRCGDINLDL